MKPTVLVIDDEKTFRIVAEEALASEGFLVTTASSGQAGLSAWQREPADLVILDRNLPDTDGIAVLEALIREARERNVDTLVVIATAYADVASAVQALKLGAFDYLSKPLQLPEFVVTVRKAIEAQRLRAQVRQLADRAHAAMGDFVVGVSAGDAEGHRHGRQGGRGARHDRPHPGRVRHRQGADRRPHRAPHARPQERDRSSRSTARRCRRACSKASSSGTSAARSPTPRPRSAASSRRPTAGRCCWTRSARCPSGTQAKLLKVLEEMTFRRLGGTRDLSINVRVVAATNKELADEVERGAFRLDLYHRLDVFHIRVPPLRERPRGHPAAGARTSCRASRPACASRPIGSRPRPRSCCWATTIPATSASCATSSSAPSSCRPATPSSPTAS